MPRHVISQLAHVELLTPQLDDSVRFFEDVIGLEESARNGASVYLRAWGETFHHSLKLTDADTAGLGHVGWRADSEEALQAVARDLEAAGLGRGWISGDRPDLLDASILGRSIDNGRIDPGTGKQISTLQLPASVFSPNSPTAPRPFRPGANNQGSNLGNHLST